MSVLTLPTRPNILMPLHSSFFQFFCFNESSFCRASRCQGPVKILGNRFSRGVQLPKVQEACRGIGDPFATGIKIESEGGKGRSYCSLIVVVDRSAARVGLQLLEVYQP
ncbi:uncharacterized protein LOC110752819 isoform X2 [Prunus avium]|uniref:Uncharacterized protein LOC110752819 isoform X2 n=1 Tax=Prunus avium TaxID=42229 RepID=A0A6P5S6P9_PRUAV|nr:uncharacterized protein LOC110752819 isoform X2 [Prunus avium]